MADPTGADPTLDQIRAREQKATKGPWTIAPRSDTDEIANVVADYQRTEDGKGAVAHWIAELDAQIDCGSDEESQFAEMEANADFIACARQDIPYLLSLLDQQAQQIAALTQERDGEAYEVRNLKRIIEAGQAANVEQRRHIDELGRLKAAAEAALQTAKGVSARMRDHAESYPSDIAGIVEYWADELDDTLPIREEPTV